MSKPSKGIMIYLVTMFIGWLLNMAQLWDKILETILKIGINDSQFSIEAEKIFIKNQISSARWLGHIVGGIVGLVVIIGIFRLKSWARKLLLFFSSLGIIVYSLNLSKSAPFYKNIVSGEVWLGYYLFGFLIFLGIGYLVSILIFFSRTEIKAQFK